MNHVIYMCVTCIYLCTSKDSILNHIILSGTSFIYIYIYIYIYISFICISHHSYIHISYIFCIAKDSILTLDAQTPDCPSATSYKGLTDQVTKKKTFFCKKTYKKQVIEVFKEAQGVLKYLNRHEHMGDVT